jgi:hypothetical protein
MKNFEIQRFRAGMLEDYYEIEAEDYEQACRIVHKDMALFNYYKKTESNDIEDIKKDLENNKYEITEVFNKEIEA